MECSVCGTGDELLYACERCGQRLCATHQGRSYHECVPSPEGDWTPPGARDTTDGGRIPVGRRADDGESTTDRSGAVPRSAGEATDSPADSADEARPPEAFRPGYGPDRLRPDPVEPADSVTEWLRRQTYLSLTAKVGLIATLCNGLVFSTLAITLSLAPA